MSEDRDFDPRFDPAYQRGYEGVVDAPPLVPARVAEPASVAPAAAAAAAAAERPAPEPLRPAPADDVAPASGRNPFVIALIVLSVALIGGGLYLVVKMRDLFADTQSSTDFDFVTLQVLIGAAPIAVGLGVATAIGVLFVYAVRWGR